MPKTATTTKSTKKKTTKKKATKKPREAKRGRPKGSTTRPTSTVKTVPPGCRLCHATDLKVLEGARVMVQEYHGHLPGTEDRFTSITTRRMKCAQCGAITMVKTYDYDPSKWVESKIK